MKAEIKRKWLEALRSGKYKQGQKRLRGLDNRYCCLGVLCDVVNPDDWVKDGNEVAYSNVVGAYRPNVEYMEDLGADMTWGKYPLPSKVDSSRGLAGILIALNDDMDWPFERIADWIEENVEEVTDE